MKLTLDEETFYECHNLSVKHLYSSQVVLLGGKRFHLSTWFSLNLLDLLFVVQKILSSESLHWEKTGVYAPPKKIPSNSAKKTVTFWGWQKKNKQTWAGTQKLERMSNPNDRGSCSVYGFESPSRQASGWILWEAPSRRLAAAAYHPHFFQIETQGPSFINKCEKH